MSTISSFVLKGKDPNYYHKTRRGLGYVTTPISSDLESEKEVYHNIDNVIVGLGC